MSREGMMHHQFSTKKEEIKNEIDEVNNTQEIFDENENEETMGVLELFNHIYNGEDSITQEIPEDDEAAKLLEESGFDRFGNKIDENN